MLASKIRSLVSPSSLGFGNCLRRGVVAATKRQQRNLGSGTNSSSNSSSSSSKPPLSKVNSLESVYIHPLSQIVLLHFQNTFHEWIVAQGLDRTLQIHRDGTFCLDFPDKSLSPTARIWTFYDPTDKKHWLSFRKDEIQHRFLLQDNMMPAWQGHHRKSLPERIQTSVKELVQAVNELQEVD